MVVEKRTSENNSDHTSNGPRENDFAESESYLKELCMKHTPFGGTLSPDDIIVKRLGDAMTNHVYKVKITKFDPSNPLKLLLKIATPHASSVYDKKLQDEVSEVLGRALCGPRIVSNFTCGMIQEYIDGHTLEPGPRLCIPILVSLAAEIGRFHKRATAAAPPHWDRTPVLFKKIEGWITLARRMVSENSLNVDVEPIVESCNSFRKILDAHLQTSTSFANTILFCHNDLCNKNIVETPHGLRLIDFDYSGFNYAGSEIAKFFSELFTEYFSVPPHACIDESLDVDPEVKAMFLSVYLSEVLGKDVLPSDKLVSEFIASLQIHTLGIQLFWCLWDIVMTERPDSELAVSKSAFLHSANVRHQFYKDKVEKLLATGIIPKHVLN